MAVAVMGTDLLSPFLDADAAHQGAEPGLRVADAPENSQAIFGALLAEGPGCPASCDVTRQGASHR